MDKLSLPTNIKLSGINYNITTENHHGGRFNCSQGKVWIGTKSAPAILSVFLHEMLEIILTECGCRYRLYGELDTNEGIKFVFDHKEFEVIVRDFSVVIEELLKLNGGSDAGSPEASKADSGGKTTEKAEQATAGKRKENIKAKRADQKKAKEKSGKPTSA